MSATKDNKNRTATVDLSEGELDTEQGGRTINGTGNTLFPAGTGGLDLTTKKLKFIDHDLGLNEG